MNKITKKSLKVLSLLILSGLVFSCQKADTSPYSDPASGATNADQGAFSAEVNNSFSTTQFTPIKAFQGNYVVLKGVSTYYTVTIWIPSDLGQGRYFIGQQNIGVTVTNGGMTYVDDANVSNSGSIQIISIDQVKYTANFNLIAEDSANTFNSINVVQGEITNM